jgi:hypothetical protein
MKEPAQSKLFAALNDELAGDSPSDREAYVLVQVVGSGTLTLVVEASLDGGTTWVALRLTDQNAGTASTSITAAGLFRTNDASGVLRWRVRCSAYTSGNFTGYILPGIK